MMINFKVKLQYDYYPWPHGTRRQHESYIQHYRGAYGVIEGERDVYCEDMSAYWTIRRFCEKWLTAKLRADSRQPESY